MKKRILQTFMLALCAGSQAQVNSGSNGSDGALNPMSNIVIDMRDHPDGVFQYTSVNIPNGVMVTFIPNVNNTPVFWFVQNDCVINGTVEMCGGGATGTPYPSNPAYTTGGIAGPGGGAGGNGGNNPTPGQGPGGGGVPAGSASFGTSGREVWGSGTIGNVYGSPSLIPLQGGSGGGGGGQWSSGGGGGGGAILICASGTIELNGLIDVHGSTGFYSGGGSSGGVRLIADNFTGTGNINASSNTDGGGAGRVRADVMINNFTGQIDGTFSQGSPFSGLLVVQTSRVPTTAEGKPAYLISPLTPSQLMAYHGGIFTANLASIDPNQMTIVLTHGWIPVNPLTGGFLFDKNGPDGWPTDMASQLRANGFMGNIIAWNWTNAATSSALHPNIAGGQTPCEGIALGQALTNALGVNYSQKIHFVGHSFGTLVNAYAANFLQGANFAGEPFSSHPWSAANMLMTLFDEAEVGTDNDFSLDRYDVELLFKLTADPFQQSYPYSHPLPKQFAWAENYISAVGLPHTNTANFILTNNFPASAPDFFSWFKEFGNFHAYPIQWYENSIPSSNPTAGYRWSALWSSGNPTFANAPTNGSIYMENIFSDLVHVDWVSGTNYLAARYQNYLDSLWSRPAQPNDGLVLANGGFSGQLSPNPNNANLEGIVLSLNTGLPNSLQSQIKLRPLDLTPNDESNNTNVPAYAWMPLVVPTNAISMSFNYSVQGDWQNDSLSVAWDGTNVLFLLGSQIPTNVIFNGGPIDVSTHAGQTNELFIGIVGGTSTNAQLTIENLVFTFSTQPTLQVKNDSERLILSWPIAAQDFRLQMTTNLADPTSWATLTNVPAIVNLQCAATNQATQLNQFFRLVNSKGQ